MIDFGRSYFTWKSKPMQRDPYYKYPGGFVGREGAEHRVRIQLDAACTLTNDKTGLKQELFLLCPCRTEFTIVKDNLFQIPNGEFRPVFGREFNVPISSRPSSEPENLRRSKLSDRFADYSIEVRNIEGTKERTTPEQVIEATTADELMNGQTTYRDPQRGVTVTLEYPIKLINLQQKEKLFQVCMGPVPLPDLATWDGVCVDRMFLAELAFSEFDYIEFALRRDVEASDKEKGWLTAVRGRDRLELHDSNRPAPGAAPSRPNLKAYNEIISQKVSTVILSATAG